MVRKKEMVLFTLDALIGEIVFKPVFKPGLKYGRTLAMQRWPHKEVGRTAWDQKINAEGSLHRVEGKCGTVRRLKSRRALDSLQTTAASVTLLAPSH